MNNKVFPLFLFSLNGFLLTSCAPGVQSPSFTEITQNLASEVPFFWQIVTSLAYVAGWGFVVSALFHLKVYGEMRTMMSAQANLKLPLLYLIVGCALIAIPTTVQIMTTSLLGNVSNSPLNYASIGDSGVNLEPVFQIVSVIGLISFIRGWFQLAAIGRQSHQATLGKALTHIIAGILGINIYATIQLVDSLIGV